jgi:RND superfamily putative drug exporter
MASLLYRIARAAFRRRRLVLAIWLAAAAATIACMAAFGGAGKINQTFTVPGSQSQQALDRMTREFPAASGTSAQIVFTVPAGAQVTGPAEEKAIAAVLAAAAKAPEVAGVVSPFASGAVSQQRTAAIGQVEYRVNGSDLKTSALDALTSAVQGAAHTGVSVEVGGPAFSNSPVNPGAEDLIGVLVAVVVLAVTFGSLLAAGMPLLTALFGVIIAVAGVLAFTGAVDISSTALTLALMIGLAVGIDYALFIVTRHRSQLAHGIDPEESAGLAIGTAGSAVFFAGLTVVIAMAGLSVVGIPFLTVMGLCAAGAVFVAVAIALTLLPAILGFAGRRLIPKPDSRTARREASVASAAATAGSDAPAAAPASADSAAPADSPASSARRPAANGAERWVRLATRRPLITVLIVVAGLAVLAWPARTMNLALPDNSSAPTNSSQRIAYDEISADFGPGFNGPLLILADTAGAADPTEAAGRVATSLGALPDVLAVTRPELSTGGGAALIELIPKSAPSAQATKNLVTTIRNDSASLQSTSGASIAVTGTTAVNIDVSSKLGSAMLPFALVVVGLSLILILLVFRSIVVPIKAAVGFLLSVGASFGLVVGVFQQGHLDGLVGVDTTGPVASFLPILLMAVLFGLAMDYEVFLVSRMREDYVHHRDPIAAVHAGARNAGRVVTAAALIMFSVFASFVTSDSMILKQIAFALAVGVLLDAFVVRMTLVPAVLALTGRSAWWLPGWLQRHLPNLDIEGESLRKHLPEASDPHTAEETVSPLH